MHMYRTPKRKQEKSLQEIKRIEPPHVLVKSKVIVFRFQSSKILCICVVKQVLYIIIFALENYSISFFP